MPWEELASYQLTAAAPTQVKLFAVLQGPEEESRTASTLTRGTGQNPRGEDTPVLWSCSTSFKGLKYFAFVKKYKSCGPGFALQI